MRKFLISVAATALFAALPVLAQPDHDHDHGGGQASHGGPPSGGGDHGGGAPHPQPGPNPTSSRGPNRDNFGRPATPSNPAYSRGGNGDNFGRPATPPNPAYSRGGNGDVPQHAPGNPAYTRGPNGGGGFNPGGPNRPAPGGNMSGFNRGPQGSGGGHHDFHGFVDFHQNFNAPRHFHAGGYNRPAGWYPHHWVYGETLPALFWARNYWLMDYVDFGLPPPPYGAVWVREGGDALLIDQDSGEIITVEYGVFY